MVIGRLLAAACVLAAALATAGPAAADSSGRIVFVSTRDGNREIYSINPDGSNERRVTTTPEDEFDPALSPDGTRIAFTRLTGSNRDIWVMNADGSGATQLTSHPGSDRYPAWSPDGTRIAFRSNRSRGFDIYRVLVADHSVERVTDEPGLDTDPSWSTRDVIAFAGTRGEDTDIFVTTPDRAPPINLTDGHGTNRYPSFSPNGSTIAFLSYGAVPRGIYTMGANGSGRQRVGPAGGVDSHPSWSPAGARIAFDRAGGGPAQIAVMDADGRNFTVLTSAGTNYQPSWSRDASYSPPLPVPPVTPPGGTEPLPAVKIMLSAQRTQRGWQRPGGGFVVSARTDQDAPLALKAYVGVRVGHRLIRTLVYTRRMTANRTRRVILKPPPGARARIREVLKRHSRVRVVFAAAAVNADGQLTRAKRAMYVVL